MRDDPAVAIAVRLLARLTSAPAGPSRGEWTEQALCRQMDPEDFFPPKGDAGTQAKQVCAQCPVRAECLDYAITADEKHGIWGGLNRAERQRAGQALESGRSANTPKGGAALPNYRGS
jgi:Transcription factor WhiB